MSVTEPAGEQAYNFPELLSKLNQTARERDKAIAERDRALSQLASLHAQLAAEAGVTARRCEYADHDLFTNRLLRCDKAAGHGTHRMVPLIDAGGDS